ncbi:MAG: DUF438 domain-containing protein [Spirochaetota bacterium]
MNAIKTMSLVEKQKLKQILQDLKDNTLSEEAKKQAKTWLQRIDATLLGQLEQELIREGVPVELIRKSLCDIHLEALKDNLVSKRIEVSSPHPVHTFMEEHKIILNSLQELRKLIEKLRATTHFLERDEKDVETLKDIAHHLVESENHHLREEEALFPALERHGLVEPPAIMKMDHVEFREKKKKLYQLCYNAENISFIDFEHEVLELGEYLTRELGSHIFKEDNIIYQIALEVLSSEEWEDIKKACDKIGYCCFTPPG